MVPLRDVLFPFLPLESIQSLSLGCALRTGKGLPKFSAMFVVLFVLYCTIVCCNAGAAQSHRYGFGAAQ